MRCYVTVENGLKCELDQYGYSSLQAATAGQCMARDFDRQVAEVQIRAAILNGYTALGIPQTVTIG